MSDNERDKEDALSIFDSDTESSEFQGFSPLNKPEETNTSDKVVAEEKGKKPTKRKATPEVSENVNVTKKPKRKTKNIPAAAGSAKQLEKQNVGYDIPTLRSQLGLGQLDARLSHITEAIASLSGKRNPIQTDSNFDNESVLQHEYDCDEDEPYGAQDSGPSHSHFAESNSIFDPSNLHDNSNFSDEVDDENWGIAQFPTDTKTGPDINKNLAINVELSCTKRMEDQNVKELTDKYPRPNNCKYLGTPKVNPEIWSQLGRQNQIIDARLQKIQHNLGTGIVPVLRLAKMIRLVPDENKTECKQLLSDAITLLCNTMHCISVRRRLSLRSGINPKFASLCSLDGPITDHLFGDDLNKRVKEINEMTRVQIGAINRRGQYRMYRSNFRGRNVGRFGRSYGQTYFRVPRQDPWTQMPGRGRGQFRRQRSGYPRYTATTASASSSPGNQ